MRLHFRNELFDAQLLRTIAHTCYGGADIAECLTAAHDVRDGNTADWFTAWMRLADRIRTDAEHSLEEGLIASAREGFLRASNYYRNAYIFLLGGSPDAELRRAYELHRQSFRDAAALMDPAVEEIAIPYQETAMRGYFLRPPGGESPGPTLILNGGYDSTAEECYFWNAAAAVERGYHCLLFDGPGQGSARIEGGMPFRPDWEVVIRSVVDWLMRQPAVDRNRIGIVGLSFGGYLALRAASGEPRLAACVADPGQFSLLSLMRARFPPFAAKALPDLGGMSGFLLRQILRRRLKDPTGGWALRRGLWAHRVDTVEEYLRETAAYTLEGRAAQIACPTLVCFAEDDDIAATARMTYDALTCRKEFLTFRRSEGAGDHCEAGARLLFHQRAFAWLDRYLK